MTRQDIKSHKAKVFVGISGGVDSAVSAALLLKKGYDVTGVYIKVWQPDWIECNWKEERRDAMRVAAHLNIPFVTLDLVKEYKKGVIDYMIAEYSAGRTPNPDVMCNREVKFGAFWKWAKKQGADYIATGHYAQNIANEMHVSKDQNKDQTYFLWTLNQDDLEHVLFPIGHLTKPAVRKLAVKFGLPNADKKDSQGLCFIGKIDVKDFLKHYIKVKPGDVLNSQGEIIGRHNGSLFYTIGERHGFTINKKSSTDKSLYVVSKDVKRNTITVSDIRIAGADDISKPVKIRQVNWIGRIPAVGTNVDVRARYRQRLTKARVVKISDKTAEIELLQPIDAITPGQSLVMYSGQKCLGGGIID